MCGRYSLSTSPEVIADVFGLMHVPAVTPRFNISPTQAVAAVHARKGADDRDLRLMHWGLIPAWADDPSIGSRMINARAETIAEKPAFKAAFRKRRCLVVADGFYEWMRVGGGKQPYLVRRADGRPFAFAGIWERWTKGGDPVDSCAIITTEPNDLMRPIHNRMPVILGPEHFGAWLDPSVESEERLRALLAPAPDGELVAFPVSRRVNSPANDDPEVQRPIE